MPGASDKTDTTTDRGDERVPASIVPPPPGTATEPDGRRIALSAALIGYLMGPAAFVTILVLRHYGAVAKVSVTTWLAVFIAIPVVSLVADAGYRRHPSLARLHGRIAVHAAAVTVVIYLSGWGPVLVAAYGFIALENLAHDGSRTWRITMLWSLVGIGVGSLGIVIDVFPSFMATSRAVALSIMGAFVLVFIIRMAGAAWQQKEDAEESTRASEDRFRSLVQHSSDTTLVMDEVGVVTYASPASAELLGLEPRDVVGRSALDLIHPEDRERVQLQFSAGLREQAVVDHVALRMRHRDGTWRYAEAILSDLRGRTSVGGFVANLRDTTERRAAEEQLAHQAVYDPLTGLANRALILDRAQQMLARGERTREPIAALFIDLDNFKEVNDTFGHEVGDRLLCAVADRFSATVRSADTVGRLGGDEFVVLAEGVSVAAGPELLAERLQEVLREPFELDGPAGAAMLVTASIGIAGGVRQSAEELLRDADIALYRAKAMGKDCAALFAPEMQTAVLDRLGLKMDLQSALANGEMCLLYQPLFDLDSMHVYGVEALLRWHHPQRGVVGPAEFVPLLEETGLIIDVGEWVLREACGQAAAWRSEGHDLTMSVNVSMRQLESASLVDHVRDALDASALEPSALLLELTETALMRDSDSTIARLTELKSLGVSIAIDDFGTGYSSLGYLRQFPVDALKIDRSFIAGMTDAPESTVLIHAMVALAHALGIGTVAEGIEEQAQLETLREHGCQRGQGYLVSRPVAAGEIVRMLSSNGRAADASTAA
ncbi:MAG: putative bifunctional diguanylate cyclase/phosphodiesterase [Acidimicrobiia bacterium]